LVDTAAAGDARGRIGDERGGWGDERGSCGDELVRSGFATGEVCSSSCPHFGHAAAPGSTADAQLGHWVRDSPIVCE
jgi:hypothetical protein